MSLWQCDNRIDGCETLQKHYSMEEEGFMFLAFDIEIKIYSFNKFIIFLHPFI